MPLTSLKTPICRDLAWVADASPLLTSGRLPIGDPLVGSCWRSDPDRLFYTLGQLDDDPVRLNALIGQSNDRRLGRYYEQLWHALLQLAPDVRLIASNVPLREDRRSIGELDMVIETAEGAVAHVELAIKFYLGRPELVPAGISPSPKSAWWGPDPRDNLQRKVDRLIHHQLTLPQRYPKLLSGLPAIDRSQAWLQGYLFHPGDRVIAAAEDAGPRSAAHHWYHWGHSQHLADGQWRILEHKRWLAPESSNTAQVFDASIGLASPPARPLMLVNAAATDHVESSRILLMPDRWPDPVTPSSYGSVGEPGHA